MYNDLSFKVSQLRAKNQEAMMASIAVLIAALFVTAILPSLLIQYIYAGQQLFEQPALLEYIPVVSFVIGIGSFIIAAVGNTLRSKRIKYLEKQIEVEGFSCCGNNDEEMLVELESLADALAEEKKPTQKKAAPKKKKSAPKKKKSTSKKSKTKSKK